MTSPPEKETFKARASEVRAACVVRTLALVAMRIPMKPANALKMQPITKESTIRMCEDSTI